MPGKRKISFNNIINLFILNDSAGNPSWSLTMAVGAFIIAAISVLAMIVQGTTIYINEHTQIVIKSPDTTFLVFFIPTCFGLYWKRRQDQVNADIEYKKLDVRCMEINGSGNTPGAPLMKPPKPGTVIFKPPPAD